MNRWLQSEFRDVFPVASIMRCNITDLWMRIHSLPESKRYPETAEERDVVLGRYALFGTALLGEKMPCYIIRSRFNDQDLEPRGLTSLTWAPLSQVRESEEDVWHSWCAETMWQPEAFRALLLDVAEERDWGVSFVSMASGNMFAPYDGGADGFSFDQQLLARLKGEFQPWISPRCDGL